MAIFEFAQQTSSVLFRKIRLTCDLVYGLPQRQDAACVGEYTSSRSPEAEGEMRVRRCVQMTVLACPLQSLHVSRFTFSLTSGMYLELITSGSWNCQPYLTSAGWSEKRMGVRTVGRNLFVSEVSEAFNVQIRPERFSPCQIFPRQLTKPCPFRILTSVLRGARYSPKPTSPRVRWMAMDSVEAYATSSGRRA